MPNSDRVEAVTDHSVSDQQILDQPLIGVSCQYLNIAFPVADHHNNTSSQQPSSPRISHSPEVAQLHHRDVEKRLSATEDIPSTSVPHRVRITPNESEVLCQVLMAHNYKDKFCQLLKCEELTHAKILKER